MCPGELRRALRISSEDLREFVDKGMPRDVDEKGFITFDLSETVEWIDENIASFGRPADLKPIDVEEAKVIMAIDKATAGRDIIVKTSMVMINDCENLVKINENAATLKLDMFVDLPTDELEDFAEEMTTLIYSYQESRC